MCYCYPVGEDGVPVQVPPDQSLASRSVVNSTGQPGRGKPKYPERESEAGGNKCAGCVLSPEICNVVVLMDKLSSKQRVKADGVHRFGRLQSSHRYGKKSGHHRGLRPGHAHTGVTWEPGRAICVLAESRVEGYPPEWQESPGQWPDVHCPPLERIKGCTPRYRVPTGNSEGAREKRMAVLVDHSTNGRSGEWSVRRGTASRRTRCREGETGHIVFQGDLWEVDRDH
jgi:hypothetical protein